MKKLLLFTLLMIPIIGVRAADVPTLVILLTTTEEVQIPVASIQKITYDKSELDTMYVHTQAGTQTYMLSEVVKMTLTNVPEPTALSELKEVEKETDRKILIDGVVYILKDGKIYTMKGEPVQ